MEQHVEIIYQDKYIVAINKVHGLLVHRSSIAAHEQVFALQLLRDQLGQKVFPVHRLDRKTSGILVFATDKNISSLVQTAFARKEVKKKYLAIVRGYFPNEITLDYALTNDKGKKQDAITHFKSLSRSEIEVPFGKHSTSRYSLIEVRPETGRMHQIRKHCKHLKHPIIGDRPHGCNKQNKLFLERWNMNTMMLHASELSLTHPVSGEKLNLEANLQEEFIRTKKILQL